MARLLRTALLLSALFHSAVVASNGSETIWSSVVITRNGNSIPLIANEPTVLTPLGAQQLFSAGAVFRNRYIAPSDAATFGEYIINEISTYNIDNTQTVALSLLDEYVAASAQAFIQGLYPPLTNSFPSADPIITPISLLANGSNIAFPLGGYQYPNIYATSSLDPYSIWLAGQTNCNGFLVSGSNYFDTPEYLSIAAATQDFYQSIATSVFGGELSNTDINYHNAYYIFDYVNYGYLYNQTIHDRITEDELAQLRTLADQWEFAINGNLSASGYYKGDRIRSIAGQTLAAEILGLFLNSIETGGAASKLNLLFTTFDPMISLASLIGLPDMYENFFGLPELGSSMVFEMFTDANVSSNNYPSVAELQVRFLFRNGTNSTENLDGYPIFGNPETVMAMSLDDFTAAIEGIMTATVGEWCDVCQSDAVFCAAYTNTTNSSSPSTSAPLSPAARPAVAGVIGAIIALIIAGLLLALAMLLFGVRFHRRPNPKRRSHLGGFKGAEKMASDPDLTVLKGAAGATVVRAGQTPGHERVGSWELGEGSKSKDFGVLPSAAEGRRPSFEADEEMHGEPVKVDERV
ncbi:hypothetical protein MMC34_001719 [Xylographa carneopallida]|nr:hypothetical protein [Xylographa carneopallida]